MVWTPRLLISISAGFGPCRSILCSSVSSPHTHSVGVNDEHTLLHVEGIWSTAKARTPLGHAHSELFIDLHFPLMIAISITSESLARSGNCDPNEVQFLTCRESSMLTATHIYICICIIRENISRLFTYPPLPISPFGYRG